MTAIARFIGTPVQNRAASTEPEDSWLLPAFLSSGSQSGKTVTVETSLGVSWVYSAVFLLADTIGMLPLVTYDGPDVTTTAWQHELLGVSPNNEMSAADNWSLAMTHLNTWGNSYLAKTFKRSLRPGGGVYVDSVWPILPSRVDVKRYKGQKTFQVRPLTGTGTMETYTSAEVTHIMGRSLDGLVGLSPIQVARNSVGAALARDENQNRFWSNAAIPSGILKAKEKLSNAARRRIDRVWRARMTGSNARSVAVLEDGLEWQSVSLPMVDAQWVESQQWGVQEAGRWFRVPASKLGGHKGDSLTYKTVEGDNIEYLIYSVQPWLARIEGALTRDRDLYPRGTTLRSAFNEKQLLRTDLNTRAIATQRATGGKPWMKPSEARPDWDLPPDTSLDNAVPDKSGAKA